MSYAVRRVALLAPFALLVTVFIVSCLDDVGPQGPVSSHFAFNPTFESSAGIVELNRVRVVLTRADETIALDTIIPFDDDQDSLDLTLRVEIIPPSETFSLTMQFLTPSGAVAFVGGPISVTATTSSVPVPSPVNVPIQYVGVGANAVEVRILTENAAVPFGGTVEISAVALDADGAAIAGTPIGFTSLDTNRATVPDEAQGQVVGGTERGPVQIVATLLTGPADTTSVTVEPVPTEIAMVSGDGQTGIVGRSLAAPLVVAVTAADGLGVENVQVTYATASGGTVLPTTAVTNADGEAQAEWELGPAAGLQTATASAEGLQGSPITFTAAAEAIDDPFLAFTVQPSDAFFDQIMTPAVQVTAFDALGAVDTDFSGNITVSLASNPGDATLGGTTSVAALNGVATFSDLTVGVAAAGYTLEATAEGYEPDTSDPFTVFGPGAISWTNPDGGDWFEPDNWSSGTVPQAGDTAVIMLDGTYTVNVSSGTAEVGAVSLGGASGTQTLSVAGNSLIVNEAVTVGENAVVLVTGTLTVENTMTVDGLLQWHDGFIDGGGVVTINAGGQLEIEQPPIKVLSNVLLRNEGTTSWLNGDLSLLGTAQIVNASPGTFIASADATISTDEAGNILNESLFESSADPTTIAVSFTNGATGILDVGGVAVEMTSTFINQTGAIVQGTAILDLSQATNVVLEGELNPGTSPGALGVMGDLVLLPATNFNIELDGDVAGTQHDQLNVNGDVTLDGTLNVTAGITPSVDDQFTVLTYNGVSGAFANVTGLDLGGGLILVPTFEEAGYVLHVQQQTLAFTVEPTNTNVGDVITPAVQVSALDGNGQVDTDFDGEITVAIANNPGSGTLSGQTSVSAQAGVATFTGLSIDATGLDYTLEAATTANYAPATSAAFDIIAMQMITWINPAGGDWFDPANWATGTVPTFGDTAVITLEDTYTVDIASGTAEASAIILGGASGTQTLNMTGALTLQLAGEVDSVNAAFAVRTNGQVTLDGTLTLDSVFAEVDGTFEWQGGLIEGTFGHVVIGEAGEMLITGTAAKTSEWGFTNRGTVSWLDGDIVLSDSAGILNDTTGVFSAQASAALTGDSGVVLSIGTFEVTSDAQAQIDLLFLYTSLLDVQGVLTLTNFVVAGTASIMQGGGTLDISDASVLSIAADINPGTSPGILTIVGDLPDTLLPFDLNIELNGTTPGTGYDQLVVNGDVGLKDTLNITMGFTPAVGDQFTVLTYSSRTGTFDDVTGLDLGGGLVLDTVFGDGSLVLEVHQAGFAFATQPSNAVPFEVISPEIVVEALDPFGNIDDTYTGVVTLTIDDNPGDGNLLGETSVNAVAGQATFSDISLDALGTGFTLQATDTDFAAAVSAPFDIVPGILFSADGEALGINRVHPDGTNSVVITSEGPTGDIHARWSVDRSRITYSARAVVTDPNQLHVASIDGEIAHLTSLGDTSTFRPRYNASGDHLGFICGSDPESSDADVCVILDVTGDISSLEGIGDGDGKTYVTDIVNPQLGGSGAFAWNPTNPDEIAVVRDDFVNDVLTSTIHIVDVASGTVVSTLGPLEIIDVGNLLVTEMDWAPGGNFIAFIAEIEGTSDHGVYTINTDGTGLTQRTNPTFGEDDERVVVSPDDNTLLFIRNNFNAEGSDFDYYTISSTGLPGSEVQVSLEQGGILFASNELGHDWSPDGAEIVLVGTDGLDLNIYVIPATTTSETYSSERRLISDPTSVDIQPSWRP